MLLTGFSHIAMAMIVAIFVGVLGNCISLFVFTRKHMRKSAIVVLLLSLTTVDLALLVLALLTFVLPVLPVWTMGDDEWSAYMSVMLKTVYPLLMFVQSCSVFLMLAITAERWIAVCRPLKAQQWCTTSMSKLTVAVIFFFSFLYNFVRIFEYRVRSYEDYGYFAVEGPHARRLYYIGYYTILYNLTHFVVPFTAMIVANSQIILTLLERKKNTQLLTTQQQKEQTTTVMLLVVIIVFALCNTLTFVLNIFESIFPDASAHSATESFISLANDWSNLLVVFNSGSTFLIYLSFSENYRSTLANSFGSLRRSMSSKGSGTLYTNHSAQSGLPLNPSHGEKPSKIQSV